MSSDKKKNIRFLPGICKAVTANQANTTAITVKGINKDSIILGWIMRAKPGLEACQVEVTCNSWQAEKLHEAKMPLPCISSPWDVEPKEFMFGSDFPLKTSGDLTFSITAGATAVVAGDIVVLVKVREV